MSTTSRLLLPGVLLAAAVIGYGGAAVLSTVFLPPVTAFAPIASAATSSGASPARPAPLATLPDQLGSGPSPSTSAGRATPAPTGGQRAAPAPTARPKAPAPTARPKAPAATPAPSAAAGATAAPSHAPTSTPAARSASMVTLPELSPAVADASVRFFSTSGLSAAELLRNLRANAVAPCGLIDYGWFTGDARPLGCDKWYTSWSTSTSLEVCTLTSLATANTVWLPQWTSPQQVPEPLLDWWKRALEVIRSHEAGHVRISLQGTETLRTQLKQAACPQFQSVFDAWQAEINAAQEAYDREQYPLPLPPAPRP